MSVGLREYKFSIGDLVVKRGRVGIVIVVMDHAIYEEIQNVKIYWTDGETIWWLDTRTLKKLEVKHD